MIFLREILKVVAVTVSDSTYSRMNETLKLAAFAA